MLRLLKTLFPVQRLFRVEWHVNILWKVRGYGFRDSVNISCSRIYWICSLFLQKVIILCIDLDGYKIQSPTQGMKKDWGCFCTWGLAEYLYFREGKMKRIWRNLQNKHLHILYSSSGFVWVIKLRKVKGVRHVARIGRWEMHIIWSENMNREDYLKNLGVDRSTISESFFKVWRWKLDWAGSELKMTESSCGLDDETLYFIKGGNCMTSWVTTSFWGRPALRFDYLVKQVS
jgi:hypothetical protein